MVPCQSLETNPSRLQRHPSKDLIRRDTDHNVVVVKVIPSETQISSSFSLGPSTIHPFPTPSLQ